METNNLEILLKQTLNEEVTPSLKLDMETQRKMRKVAQKKESHFVIFLSILSVFFLALEIILVLPQIQTQFFKISFLIFNFDIFILLIFFHIINNKNRKESIL